MGRKETERWGVVGKDMHGSWSPQGLPFLDMEWEGRENKDQPSLLCLSKPNGRGQFSMEQSSVQNETIDNGWRYQSVDLDVLRRHKLADINGEVINIKMPVKILALNKIL